MNDEPYPEHVLIETKNQKASLMATSDAAWLGHYGAALSPCHAQLQTHQFQPLDESYSAPEEEEDVLMTSVDGSRYRGGDRDLDRSEHGSPDSIDDDDDDDLSDSSAADSDMADLQADIRRQERERYQFASRQHLEATGQPLRIPNFSTEKQKRSRRRKRGMRKPPPLSTDMLYRLSHAQTARDHGDYELAIETLEDMIRLNEGVYQAWELLSAVHEERGDRKRAVLARVRAAELVHRDVNGWVATARFALEDIPAEEGVIDEDDESVKARDEALELASACFSQALKVDRGHVEARQGKADVLLMQGKASLAVHQYERLLRHKPWNIMSVRNLADVALDARDRKRGCVVARGTYRKLIERGIARGTYDFEEGRFEWSDLRIYLELFGVLEDWDGGAKELKEVSRWLLGRKDEKVWEGMVDDDREWDVHDTRRRGVTGYVPGRYPESTYGLGLPIDLRARLFVFRSRLGHEAAANLHLPLLDPRRETAIEDFRDFPDCLKDVGVALVERKRPSEALDFLRLYQRIAEEEEDVVADAELLVALGRCHGALGDKAAAEECFVAAIQEDDDEVDARFELARMYESVAEFDLEGREEAFLLVNEALSRKGRRRREAEKEEEGEEAAGEGDSGTAVTASRGRKRRGRGPGGGEQRPLKPSRTQTRPRKSNYVPVRLLNAEKRKQEERTRTVETTQLFKAMEALRPRMAAGDDAAITEWMGGARRLTNQFRAFKKFYPWDKYISYLGFNSEAAKNASPKPDTANTGKAATPPKGKWASMAELAIRLRQNLDTSKLHEREHALHQTVYNVPAEHHGLSMDTWLDLFLEYAISLARSGRYPDAYAVLHAARDSIIYNTRQSLFLIHLAWASCAVFAGDEETCVAVTRYFMRDYAPGTDSYRMFSALCRVCQSPVSWYTSGPVEKFLLRQIKYMDERVMARAEEMGVDAGELLLPTSSSIDSRKRGGDSDEIGLDVCLLTIYGHILFMTQSYNLSLSYFARAVSLDPHNPVINLSCGLAYVHYAMQRQAKNRQYLLAQGFAFLFRYYEERLKSAKTAGERQEGHFNMGRAYGMLGLGPLAVKYYGKVLEEEGDGMEKGEREQRKEYDQRLHGRQDLVLEAAYNLRTLYYAMGDLEGVKGVTEGWLVLR